MARKKKEEKFILLPNREEMLARLTAVSDQSHYRERFYPLLLVEAGTEKVAAGIVIMLMTAVSEYTEGMPPMITNTIMHDADRYIDALTTDPEVSAEAKAFLKEVKKAAGA